jgi:branched-chain amino acid transport system ATP-binding protein
MSSREVLLEVVGLSKRFGGLAASDDVSLSVYRGEIHAVIGPNGAGKTTLIAQLQGEVTPDSGSILFDGLELTKLQPYERAAVGIARSFQITSVFMDMTVLDNAALAVQAVAGHSFHFLRKAASDPQLRDPAMAAIERVGLRPKANALVAHLSHGQRRQLELAMAIASHPKLLLLDEPFAGMAGDESRLMIELVQDLKRAHTILLVEHDIQAVFSMADRITVLVAGRSVLTGTPQEVRNNQEVRLAYLGEELI